MTAKEVRTSFSNCIESGEDWPPSLSTFVNGKIDFNAALSRFKARKPQGRREAWVYENGGYQLRRSTSEKELSLYKRLFAEATQLEKSGDLILNSERLKELPVNSVKNINDKAREEYEQKHGKKLNPRIARILREKKL